jgi:ketosteroid isomerase-like protein
MSEENVKVVRAAVESFLTGDGERTAPLVHPEVQFHGTVGGLEEGRIAHGLPEIMASFEADDLEAWEERRLVPEGFVDAGENVVVLLHEHRRGRGSGITLESETAVVVSVSDGRIVRVQGYMDRAAAFQAAGLSNEQFARVQAATRSEGGGRPT